jgi:hypothetical protein
VPTTGFGEKCSLLFDFLAVDFLVPLFSRSGPRADRLILRVASSRGKRTTRPPFLRHRCRMFLALPPTPCVLVPRAEPCWPDFDFLLKLFFPRQFSPVSWSGHDCHRNPVPTGPEGSCFSAFVLRGCCRRPEFVRTPGFIVLSLSLLVPRGVDCCSVSVLFFFAVPVRI